MLQRSQFRKPDVPYRENVPCFAGREGSRQHVQRVPERLVNRKSPETDGWRLTGRRLSPYNPLRQQGLPGIRTVRAGRDDAMAITYYKRFRMEVDLDRAETASLLPGPFFWVPWDESLLEQHAEVKYRSFMGEVDAHVFPCLGDRYGCRRLMSEIRRKAGFLPEATWMIACPAGYVGTVQGVRDQGADRRHPECGRDPVISRDGPGPCTGAAGAGGILPGRPPSGVPGGHGRERLGHPALPRGRVPAGQDFVQGRRRLNGWRAVGQGSRTGRMPRHPPRGMRLRRRRWLDTVDSTRDGGPSRPC